MWESFFDCDPATTHSWAKTLEPTLTCSIITYNNSYWPFHVINRWILSELTPVKIQLSSNYDETLLKKTQLSGLLTSGSPFNLLLLGFVRSDLHKFFNLFLLYMLNQERVSKQMNYNVSNKPNTCKQETNVALGKWHCTWVTRAGKYNQISHNLSPPGEHLSFESTCLCHILKCNEAPRQLTKTLSLSYCQCLSEGAGLKRGN